MKSKGIAIASWLIVVWICKVFLPSLPYKFSKHPDTEHIFGTIGEWLSGVLGGSIGGLFTSFGAYAVGSFELLTCLILLSPILIWVFRKISGGTGSSRAKIHAYGGLLASAVMAGAVFFHLVTPLGIEVLHQGQSDGGALFYSAVSVLVLGIVLFFINISASRETF